MAKSAEAFRTISEVAEWLDLPTHVLRFWESKFTQVKPVKRAGGRRYYRPNDMVLLGGIKKLLHDDGMTIKGAQKMLRDHGVKHISSFSQPLDGELAEAVTDPNAIDMVNDAPIESKPEADVVPFTHRKDTDEPEATETQIPEDTPAGATPQSAAPEAAAPRAAPATAEMDAKADSEETDNTSDLKTQPSALPSFLQGAKEPSEDGQASPPSSLSIILPDDPSDTELDVSAGLLSRIAAFKVSPDAETRRALEQARNALKALVS
jgi:resuscitation-promoting factor RpfA